MPLSALAPSPPRDRLFPGALSYYSIWRRHRRSRPAAPPQSGRGCPIRADPGPPPSARRECRPSPPGRQCPGRQTSRRLSVSRSGRISILPLLFPNQRQLFPAVQALDGRLPPEGGGFVRRFLPVNRLHRQAAPGVLGAPAAPVGLQPPGQIVGAAGVERPVPTAKNVHRPAHAAASLRSLVPGNTIPYRRFKCKGRIGTSPVFIG